MGNTHLGSCALPSEEVIIGVRRVVKDSASQPPSAHRDSPQYPGIVSFPSYLWLPRVAIVSLLFLEVLYRVWGCQLIFLVVLNSWSQVMAGGGWGGGWCILFVFPTK